MNKINIPACLLMTLALTTVSITSSYAQYPGGNDAAPTYTPPQQAAPNRTIVAAGSIFSAQLLNALNSDVPGPVLAQVTSGPFAGGRAIGSFTKELVGEQGYITVTFTKIVKDGVTYNVSATAIDQNTTLTGLRSNVNHHYDTRFTLPAAASFAKGYSQAMGTVGTQTTITAGGGVAASTPAPNTRQAIMQGVQASSGQVAGQLQQDANVPVTVTLARGTRMGLLFTDSVTTGSVAP